MSSTDGSLLQSVTDAIKATQGLKGTSIKKTVVNGVVTLEGTIQVLKQRQMAIDAASKISGVTQVIDKMFRNSNSCDPVTEQPCCGGCIPIKDHCGPCE